MKTRKTAIVLMCLLLIFSQVFAGEQEIPSSLSTDEINQFDRLLMNPYSKTLDLAGTACMGLSLLTPAVFLAAPSEDWLNIGGVYAETIALAYGAKELCKACVSRARPYMYFDGAPEDKVAEGDWDDSFVSGHATLSFAAAGYTTSMFSRYFPDSPYKPLVIAGSFGIAAVTCGLRLASGNHFMTDVLCGAALGTGIGFLVPYVNSLFVKPAGKESNAALSVSPSAVSVTFRF